MPQRALLVEDEAIHGRFLEYLCRDLQIEVDWAYSVGAATAKLGTHYDVFLLDLCLPDSHGVETVQTMRAASPETPIIVITGRDDPALHATCMDAGATRVLRKGTLDPRSLRQAIDEAMVLRRPAPVRPTDSTAYQQRLMNIISHCVRTPLTPIAMRVDLLRRLCPDGGSHLDAIDRQLHRLEGVARMVAEAQRAQTVGVPVKRIELDAGDLVSSIVQDMDTKGATILTDTVPVRVEGDPGRLSQGIEELLRNAIEASPRGGTVRVRVRKRAGAAVIEVEDEGPGVDPSLVPYLFKPFVHAYTSAQPESSKMGLGLHFAQAVAEAHYGAVELVQANPAIFRVSLPVA